MRALITGCAGFIGSHLTERLLQDGWSVLGVDCFNDNYGREQKLANLRQAQSWDEFAFVPIDLARGDLHSLVEECDTVFHLAAEPGVRPSWGARFEAYVRNNVTATQHLLEATAASPEKRFVYASSSSIYGSAEALPTPEDTTPAPFSPYGVTKLSAEHLCDAYHGNFGLSIVSLRYFSVYGPRQRPDMAFHRFCLAGILGRPIEVYGDGNQSRDFTFVGDIVNATVRAGTAAGVEGQAYNVGGGSRVTVNDALEIVRELCPGELDVTYMDWQRGDVAHTGADITRARAALGYEPEHSFEDGLRAEFEWAQSLAGERIRNAAP